MKSSIPYLENNLIKSIDYWSLFPTKTDFEIALKNKGELHLITFQLLWQQLEGLKDQEIKSKKTTGPLAYEATAQIAINLSAKLQAVEDLLLSYKITQPKEKVRKKLVGILLEQDLEKARNNILAYYNEIKSFSIIETSLDVNKLNLALTKEGVVGYYFWITHTYADKDFYQQLANSFYLLSRFEIIKYDTQNKIVGKLKQIKDLNQEIDNNKTQEPITQLDQIFFTYKSGLSSSTNKLRDTLHAKIIESTQNIYKMSEQIIDNYKNTLNEIILKIETFPEFKKNQTIESLAYTRQKQKDEFESLLKTLLKEINRDMQSQRQTLINSINTIEPPSFDKNLPDIKKTQNEILTLENNLKLSNKIFNELYIQPLFHTKQLEQLLEDIKNFANNIAVEEEKKYALLLSEYKTTYDLFFTATKRLGLIENPSETSLITTMSRITDIKIPHEEKSMSSNTNLVTNQLINLFSAPLKALQQSHFKKRIQLRRTLSPIMDEHCDITSPETNKLSQQQLLKIFQPKASTYLSTINDLHTSSHAMLNKKYNEQFSKEKAHILKVYDNKIRELYNKQLSFDYQQYFKNPAEQALVDNYGSMDNHGKNLATGIITGVVGMLIVPISWFYGTYKFGQEIISKTHSLLYGVLAGFAAFLIMPLSWVLGGIRLAQNCIEKANKSEASKLSKTLPNVQSKIPFNPTIAAIQLPTLSSPEINPQNFTTTPITKKPLNSLSMFEPTPQTVNNEKQTSVVTTQTKITP